MLKLIVEAMVSITKKVKKQVNGLKLIINLQGIFIKEFSYNQLLWEGYYD